MDIEIKDISEEHMKTTAQLTSLRNNKKGFTLIELLVVIGILAVLLAITLIAINPQRQFAQANDTKRASDVNAILNAIGQYAADNNGTLPTGVTTTEQEISSTGANICAALVPQYLAALPVDPQVNNGQAITDCSGTYTTGYTASQSASNNRVTITADGEIRTDIEVTR